MLGIQVGNRHRCVRIRLVISRVFGTHFEIGRVDRRRVSQSIDCKAQVRQHVVVDDVVEEYGIGVEGVLRQDDAVVECSVLSDDRSPLRCRDEHRQFPD